MSWQCDVWGGLLTSSHLKLGDVLVLRFGGGGDVLFPSLLLRGISDLVRAGIARGVG